MLAFVKSVDSRYIDILEKVQSRRCWAGWVQASSLPTLCQIMERQDAARMGVLGVQGSSALLLESVEKSIDAERKAKVV